MEMENNTKTDSNKLNSFFSKKKGKKKFGTNLIKQQDKNQATSDENTIDNVSKNAPLSSDSINNALQKHNDGWIEMNKDTTKNSIQTSGKILSSLSEMEISDLASTATEEETEEVSFRWAASTKDGKSCKAFEEMPGETWSQRQERLREAKTLEFDNTNLYPALGQDIGIGGLKKVEPAKAVKVSNPFAILKENAEPDTNGNEGENSVNESTEEVKKEESVVESKEVKEEEEASDLSRFAGMKKKKKKKAVETTA